MLTVLCAMEILPNTVKASVIEGKDWYTTYITVPGAPTSESKSPWIVMTMSAYKYRENCTSMTNTPNREVRITSTRTMYSSSDRKASSKIIDRYTGDNAIVFNNTGIYSWYCYNMGSTVTFKICSYSSTTQTFSASGKLEIVN